MGPTSPETLAASAGNPGTEHAWIHGSRLRRTPALGSVFTIDVGNSRGADTTALPFPGSTPTFILAKGGTLFVQPTASDLPPLPTAGLSLPATIPNQPVLCGTGFLSQVWEADPGAVAGVSMSEGHRGDAGAVAP